jgi:glycerol-3-phosphate dehydrogenase
MRRDSSRLLERSFDLLVIGGGIQGACIAWDACLRGLSVALVDQGDFGAGTSANSLGIVHGGLRYLARADFSRMLESIRERSTLLRIAPDLVEPLPVLVPTYRGASGPAAFRSALLINDLVSSGRNRGVKPVSRIPRGRLVSRTECLRLFPCFPTPGLTGGAMWHDARLRHPERLTLSFVCSAAERGAVAVNYLRVDHLLVAKGKVTGAQVTDLERGAQLEVKAASVVVAAGPWTAGLIAGTLGRPDDGIAAGRTLAVNVRISRVLASVALGAKSPHGADRDPVGGGHRYLFAAPQPGQTSLGTWYGIRKDSEPTPEQGVASLVEEFNAACPGLQLSMDEVTASQWGWLPLKGSVERGRSTALAERPRMVNHGAGGGVRHLFSVEAVKYTTARSVAQRMVDWVFHDLNRASPPCRTAEIPLRQAGTDRPLTKSGVRRALQEEMAVTLGDVIFRRSHMAISGKLDRPAVSEIARIVGAELGWERMRQDAEIEQVMRAREQPLTVAERVG